MSLSLLPLELLISISLSLSPSSLSSLQRTSRTLYYHISPLIYKAASSPFYAASALSVGLALRSESVLRPMLECKYKMTLLDIDGTVLHTTPHKPSDETVAAILERGPNLIIQIHGYFATPLERAVREKNHRVVKLLLEGGAEVNYINKDRYAPLHYASGQYSTLSIVSLLLLYGADPELLDSRGRTSLHLAIFHRHHDVAKLLLEKSVCLTCGGKNWSRAPAKHGNISTGEMFDDYYLRPIYASFLEGLEGDYRDEHGKGPLHIALAWRLCHIQMIQRLIDRGCNVTMRDYTGRTPLHECVEFVGREDIVSLLVASGADLNAADEQGQTPLHSVMGHGRWCDLEGQGGSRPYWHVEQFTVEEKWWKMAKCLVGKGADINLRNRRGQTAETMTEYWPSHRHSELVSIIAMRDGPRDKISKIILEGEDYKGSDGGGEEEPGLYSMVVDISPRVQRMVDDMGTVVGSVVDERNDWDLIEVERQKPEWLRQLEEKGLKRKDGWYGFVERYAFGLFAS